MQWDNSMHIDPYMISHLKRGTRVVVMELPEMGTWKNGTKDGRSHFCFVLNGQKSEVSGSIIFPFQYLS